MTKVEERLIELGVILPEGAPPVATYVGAVDLNFR